jgi:C-terminal processing protease CtpA/Prc
VPRRRVRFVAVLAALLAGTPLGTGWLAWAESAQCSTAEQNAFVRDTLRDIYFWYRELPDPPPALFASPEAYLDAVRFRPLDNTFSYVSSKESDTAFFSDSQFVGYGLGTTLLAADDMRVVQVFPESPASEAGLDRGFRLIEINGRTIADLSASGELSAVFGPNEIGVVTEVRFRDLAGRDGRATMVKRLVTIPTVSLTRVYDVRGRRIGYVFFRNFVEPSAAALDAAFGTLRATSATDLVLDLRYNGGGLIAVAQHLASLIGGSRTNGRVFTQFVHNDKNSFRDSLWRLDDPPQSLGLSRLVVITTRSSASASELVVNSLRPYMTVTVVGDTTYGKPVGQYGYDFCDKVLHPVAFALRNVLGQGDYFDGIPADCAARDDLDHALGDPAEASFSEALHYLTAGGCSAAGAAHAASRRPRPIPESAWQQLVGAY